VKDINAFEAQYLNAMRGHGSAILKAIRDEQKISDEVKEQLKAFIADFVKTFTAGKKAA
jgi:F-type H+-transporting ATPase subunit alpha